MEKPSDITCSIQQLGCCLLLDEGQAKREFYLGFELSLGPERNSYVVAIRRTRGAIVPLRDVGRNRYRRFPQVRGESEVFAAGKLFC